MRQDIIFYFIGLIVNISLIYLHRLAFQYQPILGFLSVAVHLLLIIIFPYKKFK